MAYPTSFHRIVLGGTLYTDEGWNTSLNFQGSNLPDVSDTLLAALAAAVGTWFGTASSGIDFISAAKLTELKVNRIDESGHYQDPISQTHVYTTPISGANVSQSAAQLTAVASLRTAVDRGLANRGRMYLPPCSGFTTPGSDGRATGAAAIRVATAVSDLINDIRAVYIATLGPGNDTGFATVLSDRGAGAMHRVTRVEVGRVIDTMRSRRSSLPEDYQASTLAISTT